FQVRCIGRRGIKVPPMRSQIQVLASGKSNNKLESREGICAKEDMEPEKIKEEIDKGEKRVTSDRNVKLGFSGNIPSKFIGELSKEFVFTEGSRIGLSVTRSLLVIKIEETSIFTGKLQLYDYIVAFNGKFIESKASFAKYMRSVKKSKQAFTLKIHRLIWNVHAERLPEGYDRVPGYIYILGLMVKIPGADIGMNIRSFNSKVYVANVEQQSMAATSCLMGDCIVAVDNVPVSTVATCREKIVAAFTNNNFLVMTLERPVDKQAVRVVKYALLVEKTPQINPRMAADTTKIGLDEANKIRTAMVGAPRRGIYQSKRRKVGQPVSPRQPVIQTRVSINSTSLFTTIMADPYNPLLMEAVPPKRMDTFYAQIRATPLTTSTSANAPSKSISPNSISISSQSPNVESKNAPMLSRKSL
uniref:PDZ domain-containing protein n=2 Tax=Parascaris univalens TaxID=6257 RepID=A0A915B757_PARUN